MDTGVDDVVYLYLYVCIYYHEESTHGTHGVAITAPINTLPLSYQVVNCELPRHLPDQVLFFRRSISTSSNGLPKLFAGILHSTPVYRFSALFLSSRLLAKLPQLPETCPNNSRRCCTGTL